MIEKLDLNSSEIVPKEPSLLELEELCTKIDSEAKKLEDLKQKLKAEGYQVIDRATTSIDGRGSFSKPVAFKSPEDFKKLVTLFDHTKDGEIMKKLNPDGDTISQIRELLKDNPNLASQEVYDFLLEHPEFYPGDTKTVAICFPALSFGGADMKRLRGPKMESSMIARSHTPESDKVFEGYRLEMSKRKLKGKAETSFEENSGTWAGNRPILMFK